METLLDLFRILRIIEGSLSDRYAAVRIAPFHALILVDLLVRGPTSVGSLRRRLGCRDSTLSSALRVLDERGCIRRTRQVERGRSALVALTMPGRTLARWIYDDLVGLDFRLSGGGDDQRRSALRSVSRVGAAIFDEEAAMAPRPPSRRRRRLARPQDPLLD
jgi:DNA-binding MarR family transcriptional regulator